MSSLNAATCSDIQGDYPKRWVTSYPSYEGAINVYCSASENLRIEVTVTNICSMVGVDVT